MALAHQALMELDSAREFFNRSTRTLTEAHSGFAPVPGMMTTAQQVAHAAQTIDWFVGGAFDPAGFSLDFEADMAQVKTCTSLDAARAWFEKAVAAAKLAFGGQTDDVLLAPLPAGPIMGGAPRFAVIGAIADHTAHHRGALTVYARLNGLVPPMPYGDM